MTHELQNLIKNKAQTQAQSLVWISVKPTATLNCFWELHDRGSADWTQTTRKPQPKRTGFRPCRSHRGSAPRREQSKPAQFTTLCFFLFNFIFFNAKIKKLKQQEKYIKKKQPLLYQALAGHHPTVGMFYLTFGTVCWGFLLTASPFPIYDFSTKSNNVTEKYMNNSNSKRSCRTFSI